MCVYIYIYNVHSRGFPPTCFAHAPDTRGARAAITVSTLIYHNYIVYLSLYIYIHIHI